MVHEGEKVFLTLGAVIDSDRASRDAADVVADLDEALSLIQIKSDHSSPIFLTVIFHLESMFRAVAFRGVRVESFKKRGARLTVGVAVPLGSKSSYRGVLLSLLDKAVSEAEIWCEREKVAEALPAIRSTLGEVRSVSAGLDGIDSLISNPPERVGMRPQDKAKDSVNPSRPVLRASVDQGEVWDDPSEGLLDILMGQIEDGESVVLIVEKAPGLSGSDSVRVRKSEDGRYVVECQESQSGERWTIDADDADTARGVVLDWAFGPVDREGR